MTLTKTPSNLMDEAVSATIAVLTYNSAEKLHLTLDSFLAQTVSALEIIIQDDGSSDETLRIAQSYAEGNPRFRVETTPKNLGGWGNYALATKRAKGKYIMWACPGDIYAPTFVEAALERLWNNPTAVAVTTMSKEVDERTRQQRYVNDFEGSRNPQLYSGLSLAKQILVKGPPNKNNRAAFGNFIHGLIDRNKLLGVFKSFETSGPILNDRVISCQLALMGDFVVVKDVLFEREFHETPAIKRNSNDPGLQISSGPMLTFYFRAVLQIFSSFRSSSMLSFHQKLLSIPLVSYYLRKELQHLCFLAFVTALKQILPHTLYSLLRTKYRNIHGNQ